MILFGGIFLIASVGGLAALLRSGQALSKRLVISAFLNSGLMGLVIALILWENFNGQKPHLIIGVSVLAGLGGMTTFDLVLQWIRKRFGLDKPKE